MKKKRRKTKTHNFTPLFDGTIGIPMNIKRAVSSAECICDEWSSNVFFCFLFFLLVALVAVTSAPSAAGSGRGPHPRVLLSLLQRHAPSWPVMRRGGQGRGRRDAVASTFHQFRIRDSQAQQTDALQPLSRAPDAPHRHCCQLVHIRCTAGVAALVGCRTQSSGRRRRGDGQTAAVGRAASPHSPLSRTHPQRTFHLGSYQLTRSPPCLCS